MAKQVNIKMLVSMYGREGEKVRLIYNGKEITRRVYYRSWCGLFIIIDGRMYFEYELPINETITFDWNDEIDQKTVIPDVIRIKV